MKNFDLRFRNVSCFVILPRIQTRMEFSRLFYGTKAAFSCDGRYVAVICGDVVEIRYTDSLLKAFKVGCRDVIKDILWSGDSQLLLCASGHSTLKVFSVTVGGCFSTLKHPVGGINQLLWSADSHSVVFLESHLLRVTIWDVCEEDRILGLKHIPNAQPWAEPSIAFNYNGKHLAVVSSNISKDSADSLVKSNGSGKDDLGSCGDTISILSALTWRIEKSIPCRGVRRVGGIQWSPDNVTIGVWPAYPPDPLLIICVQSECIVASWTPADKIFWPGLSEVTFSPSAQFMAAVSWDSKVHINHYIGWNEHAELLHSFPSNSVDCHVYQKLENANPGDSLYREVRERPLSISLLSTPLKVGSKSRVCWSSGGRYVATCIARAPAVVWIWSAASSFRPCCLIAMEQPIQDFSWDPVHNILAIVCGDDCITLWSADEDVPKCLPLSVPVASIPFNAKCVTWRSDGKVLAVSSEQSSALLDICTNEYSHMA